MSLCKLQNVFLFIQFPDISKKKKQIKGPQSGFDKSKLFVQHLPSTIHLKTSIFN